MNSRKLLRPDSFTIIYFFRVFYYSLLLYCSVSDGWDVESTTCIYDTAREKDEKALWQK